MKKISALCLALTLALGSIASAHADHGRRYYDYRADHHRHHRDHRSDWVGPAALLAITGLAIGAVAYGQSATPVYVAPPAPMPPPANNNWYYCYSSGQYYPYTNACPEGWRAVPAR